MKTIGTIAEIRESHKDVNKQSGNRVAVIVQILLSRRRSILGVQFWTKDMIAAGVNTNTDDSKAVFIEVL